MAGYPQRPQSLNPWQIFGDLATQGSQIYGQVRQGQIDEGDRQNKLQALMLDMADKKQAAELAKIKADRDAADEKDKQAFQEAIAGQVISPTLAANPALARSAIPVTPGGPTQAELDDLSNVKGLNLPNQAVTGNDSTSMMGAALDRQPLDMANGRTPLTPEEILREGLKYGQMGEAGKYAQGVKDLRDKPADYFNNPALQADFMTKAQDPTFQKLAAGYANDPMRFGPAIQNWATRNGYSGQKWWNVELDNMIHQSPFSLTNKDQTTPDQVEYWAQQYADGKVDPATLASMFSSRGGGKAAMMSKITQRAQELNGDVNISKDIADFGSAKNQKNRGTVATIDNVRSRMDRILELSGSIDRTQFPTLNKWLLSGQKGVGGMKATMLKLNEDLTGEELNQVFGGGTAGSDAKLALAQEISALGDLPVDVAAEKIKEINGALDTRRRTFKNQQGRYGGEPSQSAQADSTIHLTGDKGRRLAELRAKAAAGKLK